MPRNIDDIVYLWANNTDSLSHLRNQRYVYMCVQLFSALHTRELVSTNQWRVECVRYELRLQPDLNYKV